MACQPTYSLVLMAILIVSGLFKMATGTLTPIEYATPILSMETIQGIGILILLRAFSSGCSAMSEVEAVSNAVPSFKKPATKNAKQVLFMLGIIIVLLNKDVFYQSWVMRSRC